MSRATAATGFLRMPLLASRVARNRRFYAHLTALTRRISPFRHGARVAFQVEARIGEAVWGVTMARVLNEILAYSCMAAFVTGIVVLAAATFIS